MKYLEVMEYLEVMDWLEVGKEGMPPLFLSKLQRKYKDHLWLPEKQFRIIGVLMNE